MGNNTRDVIIAIAILSAILTVYLTIFVAVGRTKELNIKNQHEIRKLELQLQLQGVTPNVQSNLQNH